MKIVQPKFIQLATAAEPMNITDNGAGVISVILRTGVVVTHNYKKGNQVAITFTEDGTTYEIETQQQLEDIFAIHMTNQNLIQPARNYCKDNNLSEITL